jgi:transposase-like protein
MEPETTSRIRPTLTAAERRAILDEYDSYPRGDTRRGALLRRHGLYTSQVAKWRQRLAKGETSLAPKVPGPVPQPPNPLAVEVARLQRENARLQAELTKAATIIEIQKKVATLLGLPATPEPDATRSSRA